MISLKFRTRAVVNTQRKMREIEAGVESAIVKALYEIWAEATRIIINERYDTGQMAGSTRVEMTGPYSGEVSTNTDYAEYQHEGFWNVKAERFVPGVPWFEIAARHAWPKLLQDIEEAIS